MSDAATLATGLPEPGEQGQQQQGTGTWNVLKTLFFRMVFIYFVANIFHTFRGSPNAGKDGAPNSQMQMPGGNLVPRGAPLDMYLYVSENEYLESPQQDALLFWKKPGLVYGDWSAGPNDDGSFLFEGELQLSKHVQNNGSLFLHCYFTPSGSSAPDHPTDKHKVPGNSFPTFAKTYQLNKFKRRYFHKTANLLTGESSAPAELIREADHPATYEVISHWHENLTINLVDDHTAWAKGQVPPPLDQLVEFELTTNRYYPIIFFNDYWNLHEHYTPINETVEYVYFF